MTYTHDELRAAIEAGHTIQANRGTEDVPRWVSLTDPELSCPAHLYRLAPASAMTDHKAEWVLVPRVATEAMREAGRIAHSEAEERAPAEAGAGKAGMYLRANRAAHVYAAMIAAAPAASEGEDWPTREMVKAGTLGGALTPNMACASFQAAWLARPAAQASEGEDGLAEFTDYFVKNYPGPDTIITDPKWHAPRIYRAAQHAMRTRPAAQVAATPKHDERSEAFKMLVAVARAAHRAMDSGEEFADHRVMLEASGATELAHALDAMDALPDVPDPNYVYDGWARAEYFATQPTPKHDEGLARPMGEDARVPDDFRGWAAPAYRAGWNDRHAAALATQPAARRVTEQDVQRALDEFYALSDRTAEHAMRAVLESFAQPAEGVSGGVL